MDDEIKIDVDTRNLYQNLLTLVERSEARIDRTNEMVLSLSRTCERNIEMYDKHITSLQQSRQVAEENAAKSTEACKALADAINKLREDYEQKLEAVITEFSQSKEEFRRELNEIRLDYKETSASYRRLAERVVTGGSNAEVKISNGR